MSTRNCRVKRRRKRKLSPDEILERWYSYFDEGGCAIAPPSFTPERLEEIKRGIRRFKRLVAKMRARKR